MNVSPVSFTSFTRPNLKASKKISFGTYEDTKAEERARKLLTASKRESYMQPCYNAWFKEIGESKFLSIYTDHTGRLNYRYDYEFLKATDTEGIAMTKSVMKNADSTDYLRGLAYSVEVINDKVNGKLKSPRVAPEDSCEVEISRIVEAQRRMRQDALAQ